MYLLFLRLHWKKDLKHLVKYYNKMEFFFLYEDNVYYCSHKDKLKYCTRLTYRSILLTCFMCQLV